MYVYVEYPKCLYDHNGATMAVENVKEEEDAKAFGWKTAEEYHKGQPLEEGLPPIEPEIVEPPAPESEPVSEPDPMAEVGDA